MPGYRYTWHPNDTVCIYTGVNAGIGQMRTDIEYTLLGYGASAGHHETGFAYSAEIGVKCALSERVSLQAAYQFGGNLARVDFSETIGIGDYGYSVAFKTKKQTYNTFRIGLSVRF